MNIILVTSRLPTAKAIAIGRRHIVGACILLAATVLALAALLNYAVMKYAAHTRNPIMFSFLPAMVHDEVARTQASLRDNLDVMATRLGEMQAQILRLDTLGERVARLAGFKPQDFMLGEPPGRGGALSQLPQEPLSFNELARRLEVVSRQMDERSERLGLLDSLLTQDRARKQLMPSTMPIQGGVHNSDFGWRLDPFNGMQSFHEGIDFNSDSGAPVVAAAAGVVSASEFHPQYGNMIEIDHGNGLITRYAHASARAVKTGDIVMRGAKIGEVGRTGRATGTHLHFEVRRNGAPQNPTRFLQLPG